METYEVTILKTREARADKGGADLVEYIRGTTLEGAKVWATEYFERMEKLTQPS